MNGNTNLCAAGGLLWRRLPERPYEIALVHRPRYDDWTLPKGRVAPGESWEMTALREVHEETGYIARIIGYAGTIHYQIGAGLKEVRYWHMLPVGGGEGVLDTSEVSQVVWLTVPDAWQQLNYPLEKGLLEMWSGPPETAVSAPQEP